MDKWIGASGICINENGELLMVLQGRPEEKKVWSIPSGGMEANETFEECCIREINEETGYIVRIVKPLFVKVGISYGVPVEVHYFEVEVVGGEAQIQDPDQLIYDVAWKSAEEILNLDLSFPEDRNTLVDLINSKLSKKI